MKNNIIKNILITLIITILICISGLLFLFICYKNDKQTLEMVLQFKENCFKFYNFDILLIKASKSYMFIREFGSTVLVLNRQTGENIFLITSFYKEFINSEIIIHEFLSTRSIQYWKGVMDISEENKNDVKEVWKKFSTDFQDYVRIKNIEYYEDSLVENKIIKSKNEAKEFLISYIKTLYLPLYRQKQILDNDYITFIINNIDWKSYIKTIDFVSDDKIYLKKCYHNYMINVYSKTNLPKETFDIIINSFANVFEAQKNNVIIMFFGLLTLTTLMYSITNAETENRTKIVEIWGIVDEIITPGFLQLNKNPNIIFFYDFYNYCITSYISYGKLENDTFNNINLNCCIFYLIIFCLKTYPFRYYYLYLLKNLFKKCNLQHDRKLKNKKLITFLSPYFFLMKRYVLIIILFVFDLYFDDPISDSIVKAESWFEIIWELFKACLMALILLTIYGYLIGSQDTFTNQPPSVFELMMIEAARKFEETEQDEFSHKYDSYYSPFE